MSSQLDTIAAIATAPGDAGIAVLRVSGPGAFAVADSVFRCRAPKPSARVPGTFVFGRVVDAEGSPIDAALLLIMRAPSSYTGEDTIEIQSHGGSLIARRILRRLLEAGARAAEPGEFTRRAFLNGKMDLLQAEAVQDLIRARSDRAATAAREQLSGSLTRSIDAVYNDILGVAANIEATLDFPDDELPADILRGVADQLAASIRAAEELLSTWDEGHLLRDGASIVISGKPNVGKSTLLNTLLGRDRAIVSSVPGTTRDVIEEGLVLGGIPVRLIDTAGLRDTECEIEREGVRRSRLQMEDADLHIHVVDASQPADREDFDNLSRLDSARTIVVFNKMDLPEGASSSLKLVAPVCIHTCLRDGRGVQELKSEIERLLLKVHHVGESHRAVISERHRQLLDQGLAEMREALAHLRESDAESDLAASLLRDALESIGEISGKSYSEELLDRIFSSFCIGK
jgi:tRNA modification GTPase